MKDKPQEIHPLFNKKLTLTANFLLISIMLTCFALIIDKTIHLFYPLWGSFWFPVFTFLITPVSLYIRRKQQNAPSTFDNKLLFILSEIVLIGLITKTISMLSLRFFEVTTLWQEIASWPQEFLPNFFNLDFLIRLSAVMLIWVLTWFFSFPLNQLEEDESLMEQEKLVLTFTDRHLARRQLIRLIFNLGILMIITTLVLQSNAFPFLEIQTYIKYLIVVIMVFFFSGFAFLAINQYAIMKARWYFSDIEVSPQLATQWFFYSIFFLLALVLIIAFLPTQIPLGISSVAEWLSEAFVLVITILFNIITFPFFLLLALISRLSGREAAEDALPPIEPEAALFPQVVASTPWFDIIRSIVFWLIFAGIVFGALIYFFNHKPGFTHFLRDLRLFSLLKNLWHFLINRIGKTKIASSEVLKTGINKFRTFLRSQRKKIRQSSLWIKQMPPRLAIIKTYTDWIQWNQRHGFRRKDSQTPLEYAKAYVQSNPDIAEQAELISKFTNIFIQARYAHGPVEKDQAQRAQYLSKQLKKSFAQKPDPLSQSGD